MQKENILTENYSRYGKRLVQFLAFTAKDIGIAEDIMQDTFIKFGRTLEDGTSIENVKAWLFKVAINELLDWKRKTKRLVSMVIEFEDRSSEAKFIIGDEIMDLLSYLNEKERMIISLKYLEEMSSKEISDLTRIPENSVKSIIKRALQKLSNKGGFHE